MNSKLFNALGVNADPGVLFLICFILIIVLLFVVLITLAKYSRLKTSYEAFMSGRNAKSMEIEIKELFDTIDSMKGLCIKNRNDIKKIIEELKDTYQRVGIVKYDAFKEMGGKLSFSIALLNDNRSGFILNSVHSSDGCYVYTKEIVEGECAISLGEEEKKALMLALQDEPYSSE